MTLGDLRKAVDLLAALWVNTARGTEPNDALLDGGAWLLEQLPTVPLEWNDVSKAFLRVVHAHVAKQSARESV